MCSTDAKIWSYNIFLCNNWKRWIRFLWNTTWSVLNSLYKTLYDFWRFLAKKMRILACFSKNLPTRMQYLIGKAPLRQPFEKMWRRSEAREKINRRPVEKRTSVYAFQRQVFLAKNLLLFRTTDILAQNIHPCIFWAASLRGKLVTAWCHRRPCRKWYVEDCFLLSDNADTHIF